MSKSMEFLTTRQFAQEAGVSANTVSKWIRGGMIEAEKKGGKWIIPTAEIAKVSAASPQNPSSKKVVAAQAQKQPDKGQPSPLNAGAKSYSIKEFSRLTYLTEYGVEKWLKEGRLIPAKDASGQPGVDASNLDIPAVKRLVR